ncbi:PepSY-associated TM helix domain-containing protein [Vineibacter terrae]|uniref:PepSY-associated TM helix domain-containing protein n=1 Tax=Vineibacter terrae TaxID=2586908 RepID=UPI002E2F7091|nr:PepSY-associated TM helix domain-containing protein [Vineibacter terrae]HEX2884815.1 PepSY-associated TM helix domain-containing protein [Vineibacter terrae]
MVTVPLATTSSRLRTWMLVHKWTSLVSTAFLLMLCITGLPLIFKDEIQHAIDPPPVLAPPPAPGARASIDAIAVSALAARPGEAMASLWFQHDGNVIVMQSAASAGPSPRMSAPQAFDVRSGQSLGPPRLESSGFMLVVEKLHTELFAGLPGALFLGTMGLMLVLAVVSGVMLYAPFMRRLDFGTVRREGSTRLRWLDLHNLLGIVTVVWTLVVGVTGIINTFHDLAAAAVRENFLDLAASYRTAPPPQRLTSIDAAIDTARAAMPDGTLQSVWFPGSRFSTPQHYAVFQHGATPLTRRMLRVALVDAETGKLTDVPDMPWYAKALFVSQPLHFGDYGGLPLKIIWALLDIVAIVVLGSGLYLWIDRRRH